MHAAKPPKRFCAVIGHPAGHSLSPVIHRRAYELIGLEWTYQAIDVLPDNVDGFVRGLDDQWRGLSVTMPHKEAIVAHGEPDELVRLLGVGNTWINDSERAKVYNTDVPGFVRACASIGITTVDHAVIIGNGATARAALVALSRMQAGSVTVVARNPDKAIANLADLANQVGLNLRAQSFDDEVPASDLLISTIPTAGVEAHAERLVSSTKAVFDSVYDPWPTPLGRAAETQARPIASGLALLAGQAVDQIRLMTGHELEFDVLHQAAWDEVRRRANS